MRAPSEASRAAVARPMPRLAPVMSAVRPEREVIFVRLTTRAASRSGYAFVKISEALWPPKPMLFERAVVMLFARAVFGT